MQLRFLYSKTYMPKLPIENPDLMPAKSIRCDSIRYTEPHWSCVTPANIDMVTLGERKKTRPIHNHAKITKRQKVSF